LRESEGSIGGESSRWPQSALHSLP
jgi:hypothetical protein